MDCTNAQTLIDAYIDGEMDLMRNLEVEDHLHACAPCSERYKNRQVIRDGLRMNSVYFNAPPDLQKRIQRALQRAAKDDPSLRKSLWSWARVASPIAAAALVILTLVPFFRGPSPEGTLAQEVISSHARSLMANHLTDVPSSDQHTVKPWFNGKLDFSPPVANLAAQGFPLVGGRLDYLNNRPVAALVYQRDKHLINVFIWPSGESVDGDTAVTRRGYNIFNWNQLRMTFWVVSDLEKSQLEKFTQILKAQLSALS